MNWLAHIFLSQNHIEFQVGNYLADPLKGKAWENASDELKEGMRVHTIIDSYTDRHPLFTQSKQRLGQKGLLKGIVIDLTYDYLLTKNWEQFSSQPIDTFLQTFYDNAYALLPALPYHASRPLKSMIDFNLLNKYQSLEDLYEAFVRVDRRLSQRLKSRDQAVRYYERVCDNIHLIEEDFIHFFPLLCKEVKQHLPSNTTPHWKSL